MKKLTLSKAKARAWKACSEYVRRSQSNKFDEIGECITCGKRDHWKYLQAGHFVDGRGGSTLFDLRGIHLQCVKCNYFNSGAKVQYTLFMLKKYGQNVIDEMLLLSKLPCKRTITDYLELEASFKMMLKKI